MRFLDRMIIKRNTLDVLFRNNAESIDVYNGSIFKTCITISVTTLTVPILFSPFSETKKNLVSGYAFTIALFILVFVIFQLRPLKARPILAVYTVFTLAFAFAIYLSVKNSPGQRATIILGLFCIFPMCVIDKPFKILIYSIGIYIVHTVMAFYLKSNITSFDDAINCLCFLVTGFVIGSKLIQIRVETFESKRRLTLDRETDELTRLKNRRKLFQLIDELEKGKNDPPSGVIMLDIDNFKSYNDRFGHAAGDKLLNSFGGLLLSYEDMFKVKFFRYGGEEFAGFAWGYSLAELQSIVEALKVSVNEMTDFHREISVSIGIANCGASKCRNYEKFIELADKALYRAKAEGKNRVVAIDTAPEGYYDADNVISTGSHI